MLLAFDVDVEDTLFSEKNVALRTIYTLKTQQQHKHSFQQTYKQDKTWKQQSQQKSCKQVIHQGSTCKRLSEKGAKG